MAARPRSREPDPETRSASATDSGRRAGGGPGADLRAVALGATAWLSTGLAVAGDPRLVVLVVAAAASAALVAWWRHDWLIASLAVVAAVCAVAGGARTAMIQSGPLAELAAQSATAEVELRVGGDGRLWPPAGHRSGLWIGSAVLVRLDARGESWGSGAPVRVVATGDVAGAWASVAQGAVVRATVRIGEPEAGSAAFAELRAREPPVPVAGPDAVSAAVGALRGGLVAATAGLPPDARALVPALVVGDTQGVSADLQEAFRTSGLLHLMAVSGANLVLILGFLRAIAVTAGVRGRWLTGVLVAGVAGFVALCLGEPSVVRAAAMGLVGLAAVGHAGRGRHGLRFLGAAVLAVVLIEPPMALSIGFALSVVATFGLLCWAGTWADHLARWLPRWCAEALAVPLAAQVATQPIVVALSGQVSVVSVLANLIAGPLVGPATVLGLVATLLAPIALPLAALVAWPAGLCAQAIAWVGQLAASLPGAALPWPATTAAVAVVTLASAVMVVLAPAVLGRPLVCLGLTAALVVALLRTPAPPGWPPRAWSVASCDVGQGDATVFAAGPGHAVVIDTGPDPGLLTRCLRQLGVRSVPMLVLTHLHADHAGGVEALARTPVGLVVTSAVRTPADADARVSRALPGAPRVIAEPGMAWQAGGVRIEVLAAPPLTGERIQGEGESSAENDASLLLRAEVGDLSVLLAGDAEEAAQTAHARLGAALDVDVLLVPHHGSGRHDPAFIAATTPAVALVSVGADNGYGHPSAKTMRSVAATGARVARTDENGAIAVARAADGALALSMAR